MLSDIMDPGEKEEEKEDDKQRRSGSPKRRNPQNRREQPVSRAISTYKLLDLNMLLLPQDNFSSFGGKSSVSSKIFGEPASSDGMMIQRDNNFLSDMENSYQNLQDMGNEDYPIIGEPKSSSDNGSGAALRNIANPSDMIGSIGKRMLLQDGGSSGQGIAFDGMDQMNDIDYGQYLPNEIPNDYYQPNNQQIISMEEIELNTPEIDLEIYNNIMKADELKKEEKNNGRIVKKPRKLADLFEYDQNIFLDDDSKSNKESQSSTQYDHKYQIEETIEKRFK